MKHKDKKHLANRLRSREEIKKRVPIFQTKAWEARKAMIANKRKNKLKKTIKNNLNR